MTAEKEANGKREKFSPPTKVVIRRLPPSMTKEEFEEQVSPIPEHDYSRYYELLITISRYLTPITPRVQVCQG